MKRTIFAVAGLAVLAATSASAQTSASFRQSSNTGYNSTFGKFASGSSLITGAGFVDGSAFQTWCVDQQHNASSSNYNVWVTNLGGGNLTKTRVGVLSTYQKAAYLASNMSTSGNNGQFAIWAVMHGKTFAAMGFLGLGGNQLCDGWTLSLAGGCDANTVKNLMTGAGSHYGDMNANEWYIISDKSTGSSSKQEFLARCQTSGTACDGLTPPNAGEDPTPEPATMSLLAMGLAGMAGTSLRRRKK